MVAVANSFFSVLVTSFVAYAFSRYRFRGRTYGLYAFLLLQMFPALMAMVAIYILLNLIGLDDSLEMPRCRRWGDTALDLFELGRGSTPASIAMVAIVY